jgi:hypothetical protein
LATTITINGSTYQLPSQGQDPPWGGDMTDIILALVEVANSTSGSDDILMTSFNVANNQSSAANITGLLFDTATIRSAIVSYSIYRSTNSAEYSECGNIYVTYNSIAGSWDIAQTCVGSSGVTMSITSAGQIQYTTDSMAGTGYSGKLKFLAKTFLQA